MLGDVSQDRDWKSTHVVLMMFKSPLSKFILNYRGQEVLKPKSKSNSSQSSRSRLGIKPNEVLNSDPPPPPPPSSCPSLKMRSALNEGNEEIQGLGSSSLKIEAI